MVPSYVNALAAMQNYAARRMAQLYEEFVKPENNRPDGIIRRSGSSGAVDVGELIGSMLQLASPARPNTPSCSVVCCSRLRLTPLLLIDGLALTRKVTDRYGTIPIVLTTGHTRSFNSDAEFPVLRKSYQI